MPVDTDSNGWTAGGGGGPDSLEVLHGLLRGPVNHAGPVGTSDRDRELAEGRHESAAGRNVEEDRATTTTTLTSQLDITSSDDNDARGTAALNDASHHRTVPGHSCCQPLFTLLISETL